MTLNLDLPIELEKQLHAEATQLDLALPEYILHILSTRLSTQLISGSLPITGADLVAYWQKEGVINSRPDIVDSQTHARQLRHEAETRERS